MALSPLLESILGWLRAGYPDGFPEQDYLPLVALLGHQTSSDEVRAIADEIASHGDTTSAEAIRAAITRIAHTQPTDTDVARVRTRLAAAGWPLAEPEQLRPSSS